MRCVICHTHWDREWFAPSSVTNEWLKEIFERLVQLISEKRDYTYVLDGQTLILEDLLTVAPELEEKVAELVRSGNLLIGPLYAQIDFRLSPEIAIVKNFELGKKDLQKYQTQTPIAWMVDNFGFISQLPQLLGRYGIEGVFLWRGVKLQKPSIEFLWQSKDGCSVKCIFLIGGYRNLYGLSRTKDLAEKRLQNEVEKLRNFSLSGLVPLLDGYDLDLYPEDPRDFLVGKVQISTPQNYLEEAFSKVTEPPKFRGELLSGKYACVFPGTLSTRVYLKRQAYVVGKLLRYVELLSFLENEKVEQLHRVYLKTLVHDNICGVAVDTVHRNMVQSYQKLYSTLKKSFKEKLSSFACQLRTGTYVFSFSPFQYDHWHCDGERCYTLKSDGVGFFNVEEFDRTCHDKTFSFRNDHYDASFNEDGTLRIDRMVTGILHVEKELGDTYSTATEELDFSCQLLKMKVESCGERHKVVDLERSIEADGVLIKTKERVIFDESPLVKWNITAHLSGKNYLLSFITRTYDKSSKVFVKMPFEVVERVRIDTDLLPPDCGDELSSVLLAAREIGAIRKFPFQGFVALQSNERTLTVMARGVHQYEVNEDGDVKIDLVRSVTWIAKSNVEGRIGDAGPLMYVPNASCEGTIDFELAIADLNAEVETEEFFKWFTLFDDPPLLVSVKRNGGQGLRSLKFFSSTLPWVCVEEGELLVYNPYSKRIGNLNPGQIGTVPLDVEASRGVGDEHAEIELFNFLKFPRFDFRRIGQREIEQLKRSIEELQKNKHHLKNLIKTCKKGSIEYHLNRHKLLSLERSLLELRVSLALNVGRMPKRLMRRLNELRAKRRIYDYIVELVRRGSK